MQNRPGESGCPAGFSQSCVTPRTVGAASGITISERATSLASAAPPLTPAQLVRLRALLSRGEPTIRTPVEQRVVVKPGKDHAA